MFVSQCFWSWLKFCDVFIVSHPWMTLALFIPEERLVPLFQEEDYQQQLLMGLVRAFVTACTRGCPTSTNVKREILSSRAEWKLIQSSCGTYLVFPKFWNSWSWCHDIILIGHDIKHRGKTAMESWFVKDFPQYKFSLARSLFSPPWISS